MSFERSNEISLDEKIKQMNLDDRIRLLFSSFELGKKNEESQKKRKKDFIALMGKYHDSLVRSKNQEDIQDDILVKDIIVAEAGRKKAHEEMMLTIRKTAATLEANGHYPLLTSLFNFLGKDQREVERLIVYYFSGKDVASKSNYLNTKRSIDAINNKPGPEEE
mgnify:CR=1 FL=1